MNHIVFQSKCQGYSHIKSDLECQDSTLVKKTEKYAIAVVADGHGSASYFRSSRGSLFATEAAITAIEELLETILSDKSNMDDFCASIDKHLIQLERSVIARWHERVEDDYSKNPFLDSEILKVDEKHKEKYLKGERIEAAYGSTLIAVACTDAFWFGIHIGDGKCITCDYRGNFAEPIPWDEKCFLNVTTSISDSNAIDNFRHIYSESVPGALFVASDGIDDCFSNTDDNAQLFNFYRKITEMYCTQEVVDASNQLGEYLPMLSEKGSKDDMSIALILDIDGMKGVFNPIKVRISETKGDIDLNES